MYIQEYVIIYMLKLSQCWDNVYFHVLRPAITNNHIFNKKRLANIMIAIEINKSFEDDF
jgi:hypothetical protein